MNTNANNAALLAGRYPSMDAAFQAIEAAGGDKGDYKAIPDQSEFLLILREKPAPAKPEAKPAAKPAKGQAKGKAAKPAKKGLAKRIEAQGDLKAPAKAPAKDYGDSWRPLDGRKWIGPWADYKAKAEKGVLPDAMSAKGYDLQKAFYLSPNAGREDVPVDGGIFFAATHRPFAKRIAVLAGLIRARDMAGLKKLQVREISTTPMMIGKLRDLAIAALSAKAEKAAKPAKNGKAEKPTQAETPASL
jgi:hypothetical protein